MVAVPDATPVTTPVTRSTVAPMLSGAIVHRPLLVGSLSVIVWPMHTVAGPVIGSGSAYTSTGTVAMQPVDWVNVMVAVPADTPVAIPVKESMDAIPGPAELHTPVPPPNSAVGAPTQ